MNAKKDNVIPLNPWEATVEHEDSDDGLAAGLMGCIDKIGKQVEAADRRKARKPARGKR